MYGETEQRLLSRDVAKLTKQARESEALSLPAGAVHAARFDAEGCARAGRLIANLHPTHHRGSTPVRAMLLGQCTTSWLSNNLMAIAWGNGCSFDVHEGEYVNVAQELMSPGNEFEFVALSFTVIQEFV